jgi:hypothetical protein
MLRIDIESDKVIERNKKSGGHYYQQEAYVHIVGRDGPERYPQKIYLYVPVEGGNPAPKKPGKYSLAPSSLRVSNGQLELGFVNLQPLQQTKAA